MKAVPVKAMAAASMPSRTVDHSPIFLVTMPISSAWLKAKPMPKAPSAMPIWPDEKFSTSMVKKFHTDGKDWLARTNSPSDPISHRTTGFLLRLISTPNGLARRMLNGRRLSLPRLSGRTKKPNSRLAPARAAAA